MEDENLRQNLLAKQTHSFLLAFLEHARVIVIDLEIIKWMMIKADLENDDASKRFKWGRKKYCSVCGGVLMRMILMLNISAPMTSHYDNDNNNTTNRICMPFMTEREKVREEEN